MDLKINQTGRYQHVSRVQTRRRKPVDYLMVYVTAGGMKVRLGRRDHEAGPGDLVLMRPGVAQDYRSAGEPWEWWWAHFAGRDAPEVSRAMTGRHGGVVSLGLDPRIRERFQELVLLDSRPPPNAPDPRPASLAKRDDPRTDALLVGLVGLIRHRLAANTEQPASNPRLDTTAVRQHINDHLAEPMSLPELSEAFAMSTAQFSRLFTQAFGVSPIRYVTRQRVDHAAELLAHTELKLAAVARHVGYPDPYHFSRVFKQQTGVAPSAYRQRMRAEAS